MKNIFVIVIALIGIFIYFAHEADVKRAAEFQKEMAQLRKDQDASRAIGVSVNTACQEATEKLALSLGGQVLDWLGGRTATGFSETSTGFSTGISAKVSGHSSILSVNCFTDKSYRVLDLQHSWRS